MSSPADEEVSANLERAEKSVEAARSLMVGGHFDFAASRAYYAAFYAATALLLREGLEFSKHSGVLAAIHQRFVRAGKVATQFGKDLNWLSELRAIGDYGETRHVPQGDAAKAITAAEGFVREIKKLLDQR